MNPFRNASYTLHTAILVIVITGMTCAAMAQAPPAKVAPFAPLPSPPIVGPLKPAPPHTFNAGPLGTLDVNGIVSGLGVWQGNPVPGDRATRVDLSNGMLFLQKATGWWQFYVQPGAYTIPELGTAFLSTGETVSDFYGPVPVGYLKLVPAKDTAIEVGALYTLIGAESAFTFQNMNIERGLLWVQENAVTRGIQVNQTMGKWIGSVSWNDGFYSNRYTWMTGALTYTSGPHSLTVTAGGNYSATAFRTLPTPVQNNSRIVDLIYTYNKAPWIIQPYVQYTTVPTNPEIGVVKGASTRGAAVLATRTFSHGFSLAGRGEYISSTGTVAENAVNLIFGPGSGGWSATLTPTFQHHRFFARADLSWVRATRITPGFAFGSNGEKRNQPRAVVEVGFLF